MPVGYLDPGSGSIIAQAVIAGAAGVAVAGKLGWRRVKNTLGLRSADAERASASSYTDAIETREPNPG
jgi:hypothetical protein